MYLSSNTRRKTDPTLSSENAPDNSITDRVRSRARGVIWKKPTANSSDAISISLNKWYPSRRSLINCCVRVNISTTSRPRQRVKKLQSVLIKRQLAASFFSARREMCQAFANGYEILGLRSFSEHFKGNVRSTEEQLLNFLTNKV